MSDLELKLHGDEIRQLLQPGEQLQVLIDQFMVAPGKMRVEAPPAPPDNRSGARKAGETALQVSGFLVIGPDTPSLNKMLGVVSAAGHAGSWTYQLLDAYRATMGRAKDLVVTDRRLLLISSKIWGKDRDFSVALAIPREAIQNASRHGRPLVRGRVVIDFSDGSMIALKLGSVFTRQARRLVNALTRPGAAPAP